jgi:hypothetical protein
LPFFHFIYNNPLIFINISLVRTSFFGKKTSLIELPQEAQYIFFHHSRFAHGAH